MRKIVYDVAMSLDGYIAGPDSDISMFPLEGEHVVDYRKRLETYDTVIMGRRTYEFGYRFGLEPGRRAYPHMEHLIFSTSLELPAEGEVAVVTENWVENLEDLKSSSGGDIYLCGGGAFAGLLAAANLIDRLVLKVAPVAIGGGTRLFGSLDQPAHFRLQNQRPYPGGVVVLEYDRLL